MVYTSPAAGTLREAFFGQVPQEVSTVIRRIVDACGRTPVYLVGGAVRDLLLDRPLVDVDLAIEANAADIMPRALANMKVAVHARFETATVRIAGTRVDAAATRTETYAAPGLLPTVTPGSIEEDLRRRDFTINAMALRLTGDAELLDPCGGRGDARARVVRVLHAESFIDDATRIFRALRYAARLDFELEPKTASLLGDGTPYIDTIGGERLRREIELTLTEETAGQALQAGSAWGALRAIHPSLTWGSEQTRALNTRTDVAVRRTPFGFALIAAAASTEEAERICTRLRLRRDEAAAVRGIASMQSVESVLRRPDAKPSGVAMLLDRYPVASVAGFAATARDAIARQMALRYLADWRHVKPLLSGRDLQDLGVPAGPQIGKALQLIRAARLDGWATDRGDEQALALRFAKSIRDSNADPAR